MRGRICEKAFWCGFGCYSWKSSWKVVWTKTFPSASRNPCSWWAVPCISRVGGSLRVAWMRDYNQRAQRLLLTSLDLQQRATSWMQNRSSCSWNSCSHQRLSGREQSLWAARNTNFSVYTWFCLDMITLIHPDLSTHGVTQVESWLIYAIWANGAMNKNPGCVGFIGDYTTQLCGDLLFHKPWNKDLQAGFNGKQDVLFVLGGSIRDRFSPQSFLDSQHPMYAQVTDLEKHRNGKKLSASLNRKPYLGLEFKHTRWARDPVISGVMGPLQMAKIKRVTQ